MIKDIATLIADYPLFAGLTREHIDLLSGCAKNVRFGAGEQIYREGNEANQFYIIRHGSVYLDLYVPQHGPLTLDTIDAGEVLGISWLFPPYRWAFDARAADEVRATEFDAECLRKKCDADPQLGYLLMKQFAAIGSERAQTVRLRLIDLYDAGSSSSPNG